MAPQRQPHASIVGDDVRASLGVAKGIGVSRAECPGQTARKALHSNGRPMRLAAVPRQGGQRAGAGEQFDLALGQACAVGERLDILKRPGLETQLGDGAALVFDQARHHPQTQSDLGLTGRVGFEGAVPVTRLHIHRPERHAMASGIVLQLRGGIKSHRPTVEETGGKRGAGA